MKRHALRQRLRSWLRRQLYSFFSSLGTLLSHPAGTAMTVLVLGIAMALPLGLYVALENLDAVDLRRDEWGTITAFLGPDVATEAAVALTAEIDARADAAATAVSPEEALHEFREASGFGQALDVLADNPLPWLIEIRPRPAAGETVSAVVGRLQAWLEADERVESILVDTKWLQRLAGLLALGEAVVTVLALLFSLAVLVVVANTIRLDVANRADEIEVLSLVGAANGFIRQPFLYSGFWYGLLGALLALILLGGCLAYLRSPLQDVLDGYGQAIELTAIGSLQALLVLVAGGLLGLAGAWISVARYLRALRRGGFVGRL